MVAIECVDKPTIGTEDSYTGNIDPAVVPSLFNICSDIFADTISIGTSVHIFIDFLTPHNGVSVQCFRVPGVYLIFTTSSSLSTIAFNIAGIFIITCIRF